MALVGCVLFVGVGPASAFTGRTYFGFFGPDGTEDSRFSTRTWQMSFEESAKELVVIEENGGECVDRFGATEAGTPMEPDGFLEAGGKSLCPTAANLSDVTVDNSATLSQGRIYVAGAGNLFAFDQNGAAVGGSFPLTLSTNAIAVDSLGRLWVGTGDNIAEYGMDGSLLGEPVKSLGGVGDLAFDSNDNLYVLAGGQVRRFLKGGGYSTSEVIDPGNPRSADNAIALDRSDDHLFVRRTGGGREIDEYDVSGPGPVFPQVPGSPFTNEPDDVAIVRGMAVDEDDHILYVGTDGPPAEIYAFGSYGTHPEVSTGGASGVTNVTATLSGNVDPEGTMTSCRFEYGTTINYGTSVPCAADPGSGNGVVAVHADLSGLKSSTPYHFRLVARNSIGPVVGADQQFTTFGPPSIFEAGFDSATTTGATVSAAINPANQPTTYRVEYTSEADYQANSRVDELQLLRVDASAGTFVLGFEGQKTPPLSFDASAAEVEEALNGLSAIGEVDGSVTVSGGPGDAGATHPYEITFGGTLGGEDVPGLSAEGSGGSAAVETITQGHSHFAQAQRTPIPDGQIAAGTQAVTKAETIAGLGPDSAYRFRFVASNVSGTRRGEALELRTYPTPEIPPCPSEEFRTGLPEGGLPDCRAYEVVSGGLRGLIPQGLITGGVGTGFGTDPVSPDGNSVIFTIGGASLPGEKGANGTNNRYEAIRDADGWHKRLVSMSGEQATIAHPDGASSDHQYAIWDVESCCGGSLAHPTEESIYLRRPDGSFELLGQGEPGFESQRPAQIKWISADGSHVIFTSSLQLAPESPPKGTTAIYDRTPAGLRVVSLGLSGQPLGAGKDAEYKGVSADGSVVSFTVKGEAPLYLRVDNKETRQVVIATNTFAGLSASGDQLFYLKNGDLFHYNVAKKAVKQVSQNGAVTVVNISADGSHVYFVSAKVLDEEEEGTAGANNLYVWDAGGEKTHFVAILDPADLSGPVNLGRWVSDVLSSKQSEQIGPANDPSRTTPDGTAIVFESSAHLSDYDNDGHREIYRYDAATERLGCISCSPIGTRPRSNAALQASNFTAVDPLTLIHNISDDGDRAFFETGDALVAGDTDGVTDVYEWEAEGKEDCQEVEGCLYLISSGKSEQPQAGFGGNYLYAATPSGDDVLIRSNDVLVPASGEGVAPTIYDARVEGGVRYPPEEKGGCEDLGTCKPPPPPPPVAPRAGTPSFVAPENPKPRPGKCPKSTRKVKRHGKTICVKKHAKHKHQKSGRASR